MLGGTSMIQGVLGVISAMITPAILILGTGSLVASTLTRLSRVIDRARVVIEKIADARAHGDAATASAYTGLLRTYSRRVGLAERALTLYYVAIVLFVAASLSIAVIEIVHGSAPAIALALVVLGALALAAGTTFLAIETTLATGILRTEMAFSLSCERENPPAAEAMV